MNRREGATHLSFFHGERAEARCATYQDATPILTIDVDQVHVSVSSYSRRHDRPTADHVRFARDLVEAAQTYLAELEPRRAETTGTSEVGAA